MQASVIRCAHPTGRPSGVTSLRSVPTKTRSPATDLDFLWEAMLASRRSRQPGLVIHTGDSGPAFPVPALFPYKILN
jgi:hypothetical protein